MNQLYPTSSKCFLTTYVRCQPGGVAYISKIVSFYAHVEMIASEYDEVGAVLFSGAGYPKIDGY